MTFTQLVIENALINEVTNQRRLYSAAVAQNNDSEAQKIWDRINELKNQITNLKEDETMTREEKLYSMNGEMLIEVAAKAGLKITKNDLKKGKKKIVPKILEAEAAKAQTEEIAEEAPKAKRRKRTTEATETAVEAPISQSEEVSEETKQNAKPKAKKSNLKLTELTYKGETKSIKEWAVEINMPWPTLYDRVNRNGWTVEDAIEIPLGQRRPK